MLVSGGGEFGALLHQALPELCALTASTFKFCPTSNIHGYCAFIIQNMFLSLGINVDFLGLIDGFREWTLSATFSAMG